MTEKKEARIVAHILETEQDGAGDYLVCMTREGETGYYRTDWSYGPNLKLAREACDDRNSRSGISKAEAEAIVFCSMFPGADYEEALKDYSKHYGKQAAKEA